MKFFTKSLLTLALLVAGVTGVNASETVVYSLDYSTQTSFSFWKPNQLPEGATVSVQNGLLVIDNTSDSGNMYDLQLWIGQPIPTQQGLDYRVEITYKSTIAGGVWIGLGGWSDRPTNYGASVSVSENYQKCTSVFTAYNKTATDNFVMWQSRKLVGTVYIQKVEVIEIAPDDPLLLPKNNLQAAIDAGDSQNPNFKTSMSFNALKEAVAAGKAVKEKADVTEAELVSAKDAIYDAINALVLFEGYTKLTAANFKHYASITEPGEGTATGCAYDINVSTGMPYGDGNVGELNWADLADYDKLIVIAPAGTPRMLFNRDVANGQWNETEAESHLLESTKDGWSSKYFTKDETIFTVDVKQILKDKGFVRLHSIKGFNGNVTVTDMLLFKAPASTTDDPAVAVNLTSLQNAIDKANEIDLSTKTRESAKKVKDALAVANDLMAQSAPSLEAIENARRAILQAIDELVDAPVIVDGVYDLTQAMFKEWVGIDEFDEPTETTIGCAYEVGTGEKGAGTTMYGNPSVVWKTYADLSAYDHLLIVGTPGLQLRVLFNRLEVGNGGGDGNGGALTELNPTIGEDGLVDVDLKAENLNGAARLNAIKLGWGSPAGQFTKLQVVKGAYDPVAVGLQTVKAAVENGAIFNLGGQRLAKPVKGLNIINGKVVVIK